MTFCARMACYCAPVALLCLYGTGQAAPPSPAAFGRLPQVQEAAISPDGANIAVLGGAPDTRSVTIVAIASGNQNVLLLGPSDVSGLTWIGDKHLAIKVTAFETVHYDGSDVRTYHRQRNVVLSPQGKIVSTLLAEDDASQFLTGSPIIGVVAEPAPNAIVVGLNFHAEVMNDHNTNIVSKQGDLNYALWRVDPATGKGRRIEVGGPETRTWLVDASGEARVREDYDGHDQTMTVLVRPKGKSGWTTILQQKNAPDVLGYSDPEDAIYLRSDTSAGQRIVRHNLKTGAEQEVAASLPEGALSMTWDPVKQAPLLLLAENVGQATQTWLDPKYGDAAAKLARTLKDQTVEFVNASKDETRFVVKASAHDKAPVWYMYDAARVTLSPIGPAYPEVTNSQLGKTTTFTYKARDGMEIPAYLTMPPGAPSGRKFALVILPHGGPAARDYDGEQFDWWAQFLAASGYAVLQPQFRGSSGFGDAFENAGHHEWGLKMQTDLLDGIDDLAKKGVIDPARVCIVGASFGGYAALAGATLHPDAYRCAASVNGLSDLPLLQGEETKKRGNTFSFQRMVGDAREDKALLAATSPIQHIDAIRAPILIISSAQDTTVAPEQSRLFYEAALQQKKSISLVTLEGDDHYLHTSKTRTKMLEALAEFLQSNLPVAP